MPPPHLRNPREATARTWLGLAVLAFPTVLLGLDSTLLYLSLPALALDLQLSSTEALWIMDAYGFMIAGFLITMGALGDRIGRRRLLMIGGVAFVAASLLAAYSTTPLMLIFARAMLGVAGATLMPSTLALISNMFEIPSQRGLAIGVWATMFALGMAAGPSVGGILLEYYWWGAAFLVAIPMVGVMLIAAPLLLPEYRAPHSGRIDFFSSALSLGAILPVVYAMKEAAKGAIDGETIFALITGVVFTLLFIRRQLRLKDPLLDLCLFSNRAFTAALVILLFGLIGVGGIMLLTTQYLQLVVGLSPLAAGAWMGPSALLMFLAGIASPLIARRIRPGTIVGIALIFSAVGYMLLTTIRGADGVGFLIAGLSLAYLGLGTIAALGTDLVVGTAPPAKAGSASAMSEMVQELGSALGVAILGSLTTFVYRREILAILPSDMAPLMKEVLTEGLVASASFAGLPTGWLEQTQLAFTVGLNYVGFVSALIAVILAILSFIFLRHVKAAGSVAPLTITDEPAVSVSVCRT